MAFSGTHDPCNSVAELLTFGVRFNINAIHVIRPVYLTIRTRQNGGNFTDGIFKRMFFNEYICILMKISLNFILKGPHLSNYWLGKNRYQNQWWPNLLTPILCVTRPQRSRFH